MLFATQRYSLRCALDGRLFFSSNPKPPVCRVITFFRRTDMSNRITILALSSLFLALGVVAAPAASHAKKDTMMKDSMKKDSMKKDGMKKDTMKDGMKKDAMKDGMKK
jgi:pentapeptide MXKDX repeat protein